jgi:hypothetical protein
MAEYLIMEARLVQLSEEFYELHYPLGRISHDLLQYITYRVQRVQGCWIVFNPLVYRDTVHSIYWNYKDFKKTVESSSKCDLVRQMTRRMNPDAIKQKNGKDEPRKF